MGKQKKSGSKLAAQIAAEESEDDQVMLAPQQSAEEQDESSAVKAAASEDTQDMTAADTSDGGQAEPETPAAPVMYTAEQVQQMMKEAAAAAVAEALKNIPQQTAPQIVQVSTSAEQVHFLWMAPVADDNVVQFGDGGMYGNIVGKTGSFYVPKPDLSRILTEMNRRFMAQRWLLVVSGLTDEEREALGVDYKPGEVLDKRAFAKLVELGDQLLNIYPALCEGHKVMAAQMYADAYRQGSRYVTRERTVKLNALSKRKGHEKGDFIAIIEDMNDRDAK
uniref:Uncharacterized protein n=1 Tax=Siphoviridae sp. ctBeL15 TaxID=2825374 RepID=A0A8S5V026_9CAUD|nr:MAG TPA: hypothetical protein [Siphoviridae sp. ctBeL15]